jgi:SPP1 gp7 family putative phage head morphogenesis protein
LAPLAFGPLPSPKPSLQQRLTLDARRQRTRKPLIGKPHAQPLQIEIAFSKRIDALFERLVPKAISAAQARVRDLTKDAPDTDSAGLARTLEAEVAFGLDDAKALVAEVANHNAQQTRRALSARRPEDDARTLALKIPELSRANIARHAERTVREIKGISANVADRVSSVVQKAVSEGMRGETLAAELERVLGIEKQRAKHIAVGEVVRINSAISEERSQKLGATDYIWRAIDDGHARAWHWRLNKTRQRYDSPPMGGGAGPKDVGNPGSAKGRACRCQALPVFEAPPSPPKVDPKAAKAAEVKGTPLDTLDALNQHIARRGGDRVDEKVHGGIKAMFGRSPTTRELDALIGYDQHAHLEGRREIRIKALASGNLKVASEVRQDGKKMFGMERTFRNRNGEVHVSHDVLELDPTLQGSGMGSRVFRDQVAAYEQLGVKQIELDGKWVGRYVWPKLGFDVPPDQLQRYVQQFREYLAEKGTADDVVQALTKDIISIQDIATTRLVDGTSLGKDFLLSDRVKSVGALKVRVEPGNPVYDRMKAAVSK